MSVPQDAHTTMSLLARVDGSTSNRNTFAGDGIVNEAYGPGPLIDFDLLVHALHMENLALLPDRHIEWEKPWLVER